MTRETTRMAIGQRDPEVLRREMQRLRRIAGLCELGDQPGLIHFRAAVRFEGPGERAGLKDQGQLRDYQWVQSEIVKREVYRRKEIAPKRLIHVVVDARDSADPRQCDRVVEAARLVGGQALLTPGATVTLTAFGTTRPVPPS